MSRQASPREVRRSAFIMFCATPVVGLLIVVDGRDRFAVLAAAALSFMAGWIVKALTDEIRTDGRNG